MKPNLEAMKFDVSTDPLQSISKSYRLTEEARQMNARGWKIKSCECKGFPARSPTCWRIFASFKTVDDAAKALNHFGRQGRYGDVNFVWVDFHKVGSSAIER